MRAGLARARHCPPLLLWAFGFIGWRCLPAVPARRWRLAFFTLRRGLPAGVSPLWRVSVSVGVRRLAGVPSKGRGFGVGAPCPPGQFQACWFRIGAFRWLWRWRAVWQARGSCLQAGFAKGCACWRGFVRVAGVFSGLATLPAVVLDGLARSKLVGLARRQRAGVGFGGGASARHVFHCPTLRAGGRAGAFAPPEGIQPRKRFLPLAFFRQIPRPPLTLAVGQFLAKDGRLKRREIRS